MRFEQVKNVLDHVVAYHRELALEYRKLAKQTRDPRVSMLLLYLADHEIQVRKGIEGYAAGDDRTVLDTWLQNAPDLKHPHLLEELKDCLCCTSVDEILEIAEKIHQTLGHMYRSLARETAISEEQELFESLAQYQEAEMRRMVRDTARLDIY